MVRNTKKHVQEKGILCSSNPKKGSPLPYELLHKVQAFYREADVSKELAGKKECISVREGGTRILKQKRLIMANLKEIYAMYKERFPNDKIGFSKFAESRPPECVLAGAAGTHTVCVCAIHESFRLKFVEAHFDRIEVGGVKVFQTYRDVLKKCLCEPPSESCFLNKCNVSACGELTSVKDLVWSYLDDNDISEVQYKHWSQQERCCLDNHVEEVESFVEGFFDAIPDVRKHDYIAKSQADFFKKTRDGLKEGEVLVVADFSENYSFVYQNSVQAVHYNNTQATIHPFAAYVKRNGDIVPLNCVVISDNLEHNTTTFHAFLRRFVKFVKSAVTTLIKIIYFSDGAVAQYKNRFNIINLLYHEKEFGVPAEWHYFATAHGKGPSDGLGGTLKRLAIRASLQGTTIQTPKQLYDWAAANCNLNVEFVSSAECCQEKELLKDRFESAVTIPGIRSMHAAIPVGNDSIQMKTVSNAASGPMFALKSKKRTQKDKKSTTKSKICKK